VTLTGREWKAIAVAVAVIGDVWWLPNLFAEGLGWWAVGANVAGMLVVLTFMVKTKVGPTAHAVTIDNSDGLGELNYESYRAVHNGHGDDWPDLTDADRLAWCTAARVVSEHIRSVDRVLTKGS